MAPSFNDPNIAILPDFRTEEHEAARNQLIANGVAGDAQLRTLGREQLEEADRDTEELWRLATEEERDRQQAIAEEQEAACKEERRKTSNSKVPSVLVVIPSHYAVHKLKAGEYCELYYFTNKGLKDAKKNLLSTEVPRLTLMMNAKGQQMWVNTNETRDPKAVVTKDKNLSWEHFNEAAPHMITAMKQHEWPEDRVTMHIRSGQRSKIIAGGTLSTH
ncbi:hypothetical protein DFH29DRAFT_881768 [Suillus ampliporus]|nr:hypothetical protein DFH29DRAFT_881768 [Suillus ampliporus]